MGQDLGKMVRGSLIGRVTAPFQVFDAPAAAWNFVDARKVNCCPLKSELETLYRPVTAFERGAEQQEASQAILQAYGGSTLSRLPPEVENVLGRIAVSNHDLSRLAWRAAALINSCRRLTLDSGAKLNLTWLEGPKQSFRQLKDLQITKKWMVYSQNFNQVCPELEMLIPYRFQAIHFGGQAPMVVWCFF